MGHGITYSKVMAMELLIILVLNTTTLTADMLCDGDIFCISARHLLYTCTIFMNHEYGKYSMTTTTTNHFSHIGTQSATLYQKTLK